jgi:hypothetical protein
LQYEAFKEMVLNYGKTAPVEFTYKTINPDRSFNITTRKFVKKYSPVCRKGVIQFNSPKDIRVLPFGYVE